MSKPNWDEYNLHIFSGCMHGGCTHFSVFMRNETEPMFKLCIMECESDRVRKVEVNLSNYDEDEWKNKTFIRNALMAVLHEFQIEAAVEYREFLRSGGYNVNH